jgi:opacity protein-like surface antigen
MKKLFVAAVAAATLSFAASAAHAQDTAPDGTSGFGFEPYVGVLGGYHSFDTFKDGPRMGNGRGNGALVGAVGGVNIPLGPVFVGAEGNVNKGFHEIDWEYGVAGRFGFRAGESGLIYGKAGYQWVNFDRGPKAKDMLYGVGVEVGPKDIGLGGLTGNSGVRLRLDMDTVDFKSIRPMAGVVMHF